jgi:hypothetical protein
MNHTLKIATAALAIYAIYLPVALIVGHHHVPAARPAGMVVEKIGKMHFDNPDHYVARLYVFGSARFPDTSKIAVYENLTPLSDVNFTPDTGGYVTRFRASDGSDPRTNGRSYWAVAE